MTVSVNCFQGGESGGRLHSFLEVESLENFYKITKVWSLCKSFQSTKIPEIQEIQIQRKILVFLVTNIPCCQFHLFTQLNHGSLLSMTQPTNTNTSHPNCNTITVSKRTEILVVGFFIIIAISSPNGLNHIKVAPNILNSMELDFDSY